MLSVLVVFSDDASEQAHRLIIELPLLVSHALLQPMEVLIRASFFITTIPKLTFVIFSASYLHTFNGSDEKTCSYLLLDQSALVEGGQSVDASLKTPLVLQEVE